MSLVKSLATVGGMTMISRVLGFVRDVLVAGALGSGPVADAFVVAFRFPNLFRRFFAEGAFNAAFVPLFAKRLEGDGKEEAQKFAEEAFSGLLFVLLGLTAVVQITMPWLMVVLAPGFIDDPQRFDLAVLFTRIAFPYLLFMSLVALLSGILNSFHRFAAAAGAPILLNVILVGALLFAAPYTETPGHALVWGVFAAGIGQFLLLVAACARSGIVLRLRWPRWTPGMKDLVRLGIPGLVAGGITQINLVVSQFIATFQDGAVAILYFADRIYQLPIGLIGAAMGVVLLPDIARRLRAGDDSGAINSQNRALELSMLLTLPAAVACAVIALPLVTVIFESTTQAVLGDASNFTSRDSALTALALTAFGFGLPAFILIKVFQPGFFAREDTVTPMRYSAVNAAINISLGIVLFYFLGLVGLAIATSTAAWVNVILLGTHLYRDSNFQPDERLKTRFVRIVVASGGMGVFLWVAAIFVTPWIASGSFPLQVAALAVLVLGGAAVYGILAEVTGATRLRDLKDGFRRTGRT